MDGLLSRPPSLCQVSAPAGDAHPSHAGASVRAADLGRIKIGQLIEHNLIAEILDVATGAAERQTVSKEPAPASRSTAAEDVNRVWR